MKQLPKTPPVNPAAERERVQPRREPDLDTAIDDETGGLIRPKREDLRTDRRPADTDNKPHHY